MFPSVVEDTLVGIVLRVGTFDFAGSCGVVDPCSESEVEEGIDAEPFPVEVGVESAEEAWLCVANEDFVGCVILEGECAVALDVYLLTCGWVYAG